MTPSAFFMITLANFPGSGQPQATPATQTIAMGVITQISE